MHLLATSGADLDDLEQAVDLAQSPADIVVLSFSDSDLSALGEAWTGASAELPTLRLASLKRLKHPMSVDLYIDNVIVGARAVVVRCLGGLDYWRYGMERIAAVCRSRKILFAALPGDDRADDRLDDLSTLPKDATARLYGYLHEGGVGNAREAMRYLATLLGRATPFAEPVAIGSIVGFVPDRGAVAVDDLCRSDARPTALMVFYRASLLAADTAAIAELMRALESEGLAAAAVAVTSLKDPSIADALGRLMRQRCPAIILNATAFSALRDDGTTVLDVADVPVLQIVQAQSTEEAWASSSRGLSPTDLAMNVVLPELDGRLLARPIAFKGEMPVDPRLQFGAARYVPQHDRIGFVARLAARWAQLRALPAAERRVALMLSDYPARGGRRGYAVGLDTSASAAGIAGLLAKAGYDVGDAPPAAEAVEALLRDEADEIAVPLAFYQRALALLPDDLQRALQDSWGEADADPAFRDGAFRFSMLRAGKLIILLQPDRGSRADRKSGYHDTTVPPRHAYVALYAYLREAATVDALIHLGAHGTLEWLPGKALALSSACWPEAVLGPLPVIYPFIVNNPGEAMQAKRRLAALTLGHLTPPLSQAGLHGPLLELEGLVEEYAEADGLDKRRLKLLEDEIIARAWQSGLAADCGLDRTMSGREAIAQLDAQLCDIKELAVRDRLHVFGQAPEAAAIGLLADAMTAAAGQTGGVLDRVEVEARLEASAAAERSALLAALAGRRVAAGPAGAPSRGRLDVLPTGRNLTAIDPRAIPTRTAALVGVRAADEVIRRYLQDHGDYPRSLMLDLWASASLRTGGDDLAQALAYLGVRPRWDLNSNRVTGVDVLPLARLDRPRIDATLRISGLFRDLFEAQIALFDLAVQTVAALDEDNADNPLAAARRRGESLARVFGGAPGSYGAVAADLALGMAWDSRAKLGEAYLESASYSFGGEREGVSASDTFRERVRSADALVHAQDDRERDLLDGEEVADFAGGFAAAATSLGAAPALLHLDTSRPEAPKARSFGEEIARVVRGRVANPRWISGMLAHGYRGVAEIAQAIDALYAFAATSDTVPEHLFDLAHGALLRDEAVLDAMVARNPAAVATMAARFEDLLRRRLWVPRRNAVADELAVVRARLTQTEKVT
ncbi:Aerobic cobaltochelatase subunit CobN [Bradyrhizobium sp. ORS 285]|uniref:cobaltochelatase subunit CobN n=1 Tax=Bradyrhizobium sp. ORS 285 TaxID=115808 RepID=UPI000240AB63|nr:cobaltochelatase subunit CobN [Bradyrhizobium sp. ORS 285]CCD85301.1 putative cobaltochelatase cobN subunit [Bradyrhizobium sp. ORS 285]SMX57448.1 Aerobic cobaltochelatase subunit CobN [Bradyrhizobium sp. ORS 285]